jgi:hypothetical protein
MALPCLIYKISTSILRVTRKNLSMGAFMLFPTFVIKIHNSVDCFVNFKLIGTQPSTPVEYAQQQHVQYSAAHPVHLIPLDTTDNMTHGNLLANIQISASDPKHIPSPLQCPT